MVDGPAAEETAPPADDLGTLDFTFAIVGVQKAGTSTLSQTLSWHPRILKAPRKEMRFFVREDVDWADPPYDRDYRVARTKPQQKALGDATPAYLWWPHALERMAAYNPEMRLIAVLRDPIERAFSQWTMMVERGQAPPDWPDLIRDFRPASLPLELPPPASGVRGRVTLEWSVLSRGFYADQLERGFAVFPREQWLPLEFRSTLADFEPTVRAVTRHIGVRPFRSVPPLRQTLAGPETVPGTAPAAADIAGLAELYADDLARLGPLSGLELAGWPTVRVLAGDLDPAEFAATLARKVRPA